VKGFDDHVWAGRQGIDPDDDPTGTTLSGKRCSIASLEAATDTAHTRGKEYCKVAHGSGATVAHPTGSVSDNAFSQWSDQSRCESDKFTAI
jgi:hypothetical protein